MQCWNTSASFTRPATTPTYVIGQAVANSATAALVVPMVFPLGDAFPQGMCRLTRARLVKSSPSITNANFRIMLFSAPPVPASGDAVTFLSTGAASFVGNIDIASMITPAGTTGAFSDGAAGTGSFPAGSEAYLRFPAAPIGGQPSLYALLYALAAYVGVASETFTLTLEELDAY